MLYHKGKSLASWTEWYTITMSEEEKQYYHGTYNEYAYSIMSQGFKMGHSGHGHLLGRGLYITQRLDSAVFWSHQIVIKCRLQAGSRILWIGDEVDQKVIGYLRKEFGKELLELGPHFHQAIPNNKQLTKQELITLCNYIFETGRERRWQNALRQKKGKRVRYWGAWLHFSRLHQQIRRHGYDAIGDRSFEHWDSDEMLIFNPSRVTPLSAHWLYADDMNENVTITQPLDMATLKMFAPEET